MNLNDRVRAIAHAEVSCDNALKRVISDQGEDYGPCEAKYAELNWQRTKLEDILQVFNRIWEGPE